MSLAPGQRLGPYEILAPLGAGGMGEVYRAHDPRLGRDVAIKVLPSAYSGDADRLRRFQQEARAAGTLNHPNILAIYDIGTHEGSPFVVSELLEGETLRDRLQEGPLAPRKGIEYASQIARGLAAAHEKGIVHRDLKPENLFVTRDGHVKILDFGLAKLIHPEEDGSSLTKLPTTPPETHPGVVLGTASYMSPEQVRGLPSDHRSDIFSFGAVLYEVISGSRAFKRDSAVETMSAILKEDPPELSGSSRPISMALETIVRHCLEKRPDERFQSARDLAFNLDALSGISGSGTTVAIPSPAGAAYAVQRLPIRFLAGLGLGLLAGAGLVLWRGRSPLPEPPTFRFLTYSGRDTQPAASPDGRLIAFASARDGRSRIWLKQLPGGDEVALTEGPDSHPRFSPDASAILFTRDEADRSVLYRVPVVGGEPRKLLEDALEGDWSPDGGRITFIRLKRVANTARYSVGIALSDGRNAREIAEVENYALSGPRWSPDGKTIASTQAGTQNAPNSVLLVEADGPNRRSLSPPPPPGEISSVAWSGSSDAVIYALGESVVVGGSRGSSGRIIRQELSSERSRTLMGLPTWVPTLDVAGPARLVLGAISVRQNILEFTLAGKTTPGASRWLTRGNSIDRQPTYSPDGEWILFSSNRSGNLDLWKVSRKTAATRRLTDDVADDWDPAFTPDGKSILWSSNRSGHFEAWISDADGTGARELTDDGLDAENPVSTPDGTWIVYSSSNPDKAGIWRIHPDGSGASRIIAGTSGIPEVSHDGRYVAFRSVTRSSEIALDVVRIADGVPAIPTIRVPGNLFGARCRWLPDGKRLAYIGQDKSGAWGVFIQDFSPGRDTVASRRPLAGFDPEFITESFGIAPDGSQLALSRGEGLSSLMMVEGLPGVSPARRRTR